jgi:hypothetical protein
MLTALAARPPGEDPLTAMRAAFRQSLLALAADEGTDSGAPTYLLVTRLIDSTPSLLAQHLRYVHDRDEETVGVLAAREGVDPSADLRPRVLAAVFGSLVFLATRAWRTEGSTTAEQMLQAFDRYADEFTPALFSHWGAGAG